MLGRMLEEHLRRALLMSRGDATVFVTRPISLAFIVVAVLILILIVLPAVRRRSGLMCVRPCRVPDKRR